MQPLTASQKQARIEALESLGVEGKNANKLANLPGDKFLIALWQLGKR